jgi:biopolymer transport protein ExbD
MKKCSHSAHGALSELNITPLLDLAFVLLVIFILTTTPLVNDLALDLPNSAKHPKDPPHDANYITVQADGKVWMNKQAVDLTKLRDTLVGLRMDDPNLSVIIRGDSRTKYRQIRSVLDICQQANVVKVDLATEAADADKK